MAASWLTCEGENGWEDDMNPGAVNVKHDSKVDGDAAQNGEAVHEGPVRRVQRDLTERRRGRWSQKVMFKNQTYVPDPREAPTHLQVDGEDQRGGSDDSERLEVRWSLAILPHGLQEGTVGDEEGDEWDKDAVEQADEEVLKVEQPPLLTWDVEFGELKAEFVINVLSGHQEPDLVKNVHGS